MRYFVRKPQTTSEDLNNSAIKATTSKGLVNVSFCLGYACEWTWSNQSKSVQTFYGFGSFVMNVTLVYVTILRAQKSQLFWSRDAKIIVLFCNGGHCWFMQDHIVWMHQRYFSVHGECPRHLKVWNFSIYHYFLIWGILEALKRDYSRINFFYKLIGCSIWELPSSFIQFHGIWSSQNTIYLRSHLVGTLNKAIIIIIIIIIIILVIFIIFIILIDR